MILPSDKSYTKAKKIVQGLSPVNHEFMELAEWIEEEFKVVVVNLILDAIENIDHGKTPRLEVIVKYTADYNTFRDPRGYDQVKQRAIAEKFYALYPEKVSKRKGLLFQIINTTISKRQNELFVCFSAFENVAKAEANYAIPESKVEELRKSLSDPNLWYIFRQFDGATFFLYAEVQVEEYEQLGKRIEFSDAYYALLKEYDEFDFFKRETFTVYLDSKENFDKNFEGNWYYYSK